MTPERWQQIGGTMEEALRLPAEQRGEFLDRARGDDADLRRQVESLLKQDEAASREGFLAEACPFNVRSQADTLVQPPSLCGRKLGPYDVRKLLGGGGMGDVYLAVRVDDYRQEAAIKVIKPG